MPARPRRMIVCLVALLAAASVPVAAAPGVPVVDGPDVLPVTEPAAVVEVFTDEPYTCTEVVRTRTVEVPSGDWDRIILEVTITPDGDPWDRLFGVAIGGVEVLRGTTPRAPMTLRRDITTYASLLPGGGTADVSLLLSTYVGTMLGSVRLDFHTDEPTGSLVRAPADRAVGALRWTSLGGDGQTRAAAVSFPARPPAAAEVELTLSGHGSEEFWFLEGRRSRTFRVLVDDVEIATVVAMPYVYALLGFGNENANTACVGPGTSPTGDALHPLMWWTAHQALDVAGIHGGVGEVPAYRAIVAAEHLPLLVGARTVTVAQVEGGARWVTSLSFLLDG